MITLSLLILFLKTFLFNICKTQIQVLEWNFSGSKKLVKVCDESHVVVRPKYYVESTGCVWASDLMRRWIENTDMYEIKCERNIPIIERKVCVETHDILSEENIVKFLVFWTPVKNLFTLLILCLCRQWRHLLLNIHMQDQELESATMQCV